MLNPWLTLRSITMLVVVLFDTQHASTYDLDLRLYQDAGHPFVLDEQGHVAKAKRQQSRLECMVGVSDDQCQSLVSEKPHMHHPLGEISLLTI